MSTKYVVNSFGNGIRAYECVEETAKFAWLKGLRFDPDEITKRKKAGVCFDTWAEAHAELTRRAEDRLAQARRQLQAAQGFAGNVKGMKPPTTPENSK